LLFIEFRIFDLSSDKTKSQNKLLLKSNSCEEYPRTSKLFELKKENERESFFLILK